MNEVKRKKVLVKAEIVFEYEVSEDWDDKAVEFHLNDSSSCASNILYELEKQFGDEADACLCFNAKFEVVTKEWREAWQKTC